MFDEKYEAGLRASIRDGVGGAAGDPWCIGFFVDNELLWGSDPLDFIVEVVHKLKDQHTFIPLPRRWVVERTFGWMMAWRRLVRDYEQRIDVSRQMIYVAMGGLLLKRLFDEN